MKYNNNNNIDKNSLMSSQILPIDSIHTENDLKKLNQRSAMLLADENEKIVIPRTNPTQALNDFAEKYPSMERWRLFVDGIKYAKTGPHSNWPVLDPTVADTLLKNTHIEKQNLSTIGFAPKHEGWLGYEQHEPGSVAACLYVLDFALRLVDKPRDDVAFTKEINKQLMSHTKIKYGVIVIPGEFRRTCVSRFDLFGDRRHTPAGMKDLLTKIADGTLEDAYIQFNSGVAARMLERSSKAHPEHKSVFDKILFSLCKSKNKYVLDHLVLKKIKTSYPDIYEVFLTEVSGFLHASPMPRVDFFTYHPVGNRIMRHGHCLYSMEWEKIGLEKVKDAALIDQLNKILPKYFTFSPDLRESLMRAIAPELLHETKDAVLARLSKEEDISGEPLPESLLNKLIVAVRRWKLTHPLDLRYLIKYSEESHDLKIQESPLLLQKLDLRTTQVGVRSIVSFFIEEYYHAKIMNAVEKNWRDYHRRISQPNLSNDDRLQIIGETTQMFERIHSFADFNGRTFANVILIILLLENGFPPPTFFDPNVFDAHEDLVSLLKRGMLNTLEIYKAYDEKKTVDLFGFETVSLETKLLNSIDLLKEKIQTEGVATASITQDIKAKKSTLMHKIVKTANTLYATNCYASLFNKQLASATPEEQQFAKQFQKT